MSYCGVKRNGKGTWCLILLKLMLLSCTCTALQRCTCLNILELNLVISCWEWGVPFSKTSRTEVVNFRGASNPYPYLSTVKCIVSCTPRPILRMFFKGPSLTWNYTWWLGRIIMFNLMLKILTGEMIFDIFFTDQ